MIEESPDGNKISAEAYEAWSRKRRIHERFLKKLEQMGDVFHDEGKLARIENMKKGERQTIDEFERKRNQCLEIAGLGNLVSET